MQRRRIPTFALALSLVLMTALVTVPAAARGATPGIDGQIAYIGEVPAGLPDDSNLVYEAIVTANPDGSSQRVVPNTGFADGSEWPSHPVWSPDSSMLAFESDSSSDPSTIDVINLDGTGRTTLAQGIDPAWTPDGQWISYTVAGPANDWDTTYKVPVGGGSPQLVIDGADVHWSPDGTRIAFRRGWPPDVFVRVLATGDEVNITPDSPSSYDYIDDWSPDSQKIVFNSSGAWPDPGTTLVANADGSSVQTILQTAYDPAWSPSGTRLIYHGLDESGDHEFLGVIRPDGSPVVTIHIQGYQPAWGSAPVRPTATRLDNATYPDLAGFPNDRYGTDAAVVEQAFGSGTSTVYVASGANFPDALGAGAAAAKAGAPVLLMRPTSIPAAVDSELHGFLGSPTTIYVVGGTASVSNGVLTALPFDPMDVTMTRLDNATYPDLAGFPNDRYGTDAAVTEQAFPSGATTVYVADGLNFPDALGAGAAAGTAGAPVLLVTPTSIPAAIAHELSALHPTTIYVVGGTASVSNAVLAALRAYLGL